MVMPTFSEYLDSIGARGQRFNRRMKEIYDEGMPSDLRTLNRQLSKASLNILGTAGGTIGDTIGVTADYAVPDWASEPLMDGLQTGLKYSGLGLAGRAAKGLFEKAGGVELAKNLYDGYQQLPQEDQEAWQDVGNTLNFLGASRALPFANPSMRGYSLSGLNNYIPGKYTHQGFEIPKIVESGIGKAVNVLEKSGGAMNKAQKEAVTEGLKRIYGILNYGVGQSVNRVRYHFDPKARALYGATGLSPEVKRLVDQLPVNPDARQDLHKVVAQALYSRHIGVQRGRQGNTASSVYEMGNLPILADTTVVGSGKGFYRKMAEPFSSAKLPDADWDAFESHVKNIPAWKKMWDKQTNVAVKDSSVVGGNHALDFVKSPVYKQIKEAFKDYKEATGRKEFPDDKTMYEWLDKYKGNTTKNGDLVDNVKHMVKTKGRGGNKPVKRNFFNIKDESLTPEMRKAGGVWLSDGFSGTAITEGGVNALYKVERDGTIKGMISDKHDYFEKLSDQMFDTNQLAMTLPFQRNVWGAKGSGKNLGTANKTQKAKDLAAEIADLKPSTSDLMFEYSALANKGINASMDDEEQ